MSDKRRYVVHLKRSAEKELDDLPSRRFERVVDAILALETEPRPRGVRKIQGTSNYRLRVGSYRVIYTLDDRARRVDVIAVGHRRDVYRRLDS